MMKQNSKSEQEEKYCEVIESSRYTKKSSKIESRLSSEISDRLDTIVDELSAFEITIQYHNHRLVGSFLYELHVTGDILLIYCYMDSGFPQLVLLELLDISNHKKLDRKGYLNRLEKEAEMLQKDHMKESISHSHKESTLDQIDDLIEDIYELRKRGMESKDGEYSIDNLVFKEFRNLGYLDTLKELRKKEISRELSLEHLDRDE